ncbi:7TM diverse intracellular signaling domain-containing protein [Shivajiella indica]|uniref:histidine kinase n=1 Tax=Shivajiella indica TaxID=872115 RepID=A0ABW5B4V0_9BACT
MKNSGCFLILALLIIIPWDANSFTFDLPFIQIENREDYELEGYFFSLEDPQNSGIDWAIESLSNDAFQLLDHPYLFNKGFNKSIWWFAMALENQLDQENTVIFSAASSALKKANLYLLNESGKIGQILVSGYDIPSKVRDMDSRLNSFRVILAPREKVILLLETDARGRNIYMPFFLDNSDSYWEFEVNRAALYGGISTTLFFASLFALLLFFYHKERIYIIFIGYVLACLFLILEEDGYAYDWFYGSYFHQLSQIGIPLFGLLTCALFLRFNLIFLETKTYKPILFNTSKSMYYIAITWCLVLVGSLFVIENYTLQYVINRTAHYLGIICVVLVIITNAFQLNQKLTRYILVANLFLVIGLTIYFLNSQGMTSLNPFYPNGMVVGILVNVIAFTGGISFRNYQDRKEKDSLILQLAENEKRRLEEKFKIQEEERQKIAKDLHDDLGALMAMIRLKVEDAEIKLNGIDGSVQENLAETVKLIEKAGKDIRFIAHELMPSDIEHTRFKPMISELFAMMEKQDKLDFNYQIGDLPILPRHYKTNLFRIIKEMLNKTIKHANATKADIKIYFDYNDAEIKVIMSDNGKGFDYKKIKEVNRGMGLKNLENRIAYLKGKHEINSGPLGTKILICIPLEIEEK